MFMQKKLCRLISALALLSLSSAGFADTDQVWVCGKYGFEGTPFVKVDFKNHKACSFVPSPASPISDYCREDAEVNLYMLGTWPESVTLNGTKYPTTLVGLRNQNDWMTIRFFGRGLTPTLTHADIKGNVITRDTDLTTNPAAPLAVGDGYCQRVH